MSPAVRFLGLVLVGWAGARLLGADLIDGGARDRADDGREAETLLASADEAPRVSRPVDPAVDMVPPPGTASDAAAAAMQPAAWPAGAVMTPYGILLPYGAAPPSGWPQQGAPPAYAPPAYAPPRRLAGPVVEVPRYRYRTVDIPVPAYAPPAPPTYAAAAMPQGELIGYSLATGEPVYGTPAYAAAATGRDAPNRAAAQPLPAAPPVAMAAADPDRFDRWQLTGWSFLREQLARSSGASQPGLAPGSTLGGDQSGVRLIYNHTPNWSLAARLSSAWGSVRGDEAALGIRYRPDPALPLAFTVERRESIGIGPAARSDFAAFAEAGLYGRPVGRGFSLDAYGQAGMVGIESRDWFVDGGATVTRPILDGWKLGVGAWGAAQPGVSRLDVGPRVSGSLRKGIRVDADYRWKATGNAQPGSGPTLTLSTDL